MDGSLFVGFRRRGEHNRRRNECVCLRLQATSPRLRERLSTRQRLQESDNQVHLGKPEKARDSGGDFVIDLSQSQLVAEQNAQDDDDQSAATLRLQDLLRIKQVGGRTRRSCEY